jgi:catechol 2,3-dioxygenase-like lactoylglutathione lyase family enzyme
MAITRFYNVSLCVSDLSRAVRFYRELLGFRLATRLELAGPVIGRSLGIGDCEAEVAFLERDGLHLELIGFRRPASQASAVAPEANRVGLSHLTFAVDDLASTLQSLKDRGVGILGETMTELGPGLASCLIRDPDGLLIELYQVPPGVASPYDPAPDA